MTQLGNKLQALREERGLTRKELATILVVTTPYINHLESGIRKPSFETLVKLSRFFGVTTDELTSLSTELERETA